MVFAAGIVGMGEVAVKRGDLRVFLSGCPGVLIDGVDCDPGDCAAISVSLFEKIRARAKAVGFLRGCQNGFADEAVLNCLVCCAKCGG